MVICNQFKSKTTNAFTISMCKHSEDPVCVILHYVPMSTIALMFLFHTKL